MAVQQAVQMVVQTAVHTQRTAGNGFINRAFITASGRAP
jgi:hypothetical protein